MLIKDLYKIVEFSHDASQITATIKINKDHHIFDGHFPGHPILPGVCVIQIVKELTEKALEKKLMLSIASNVKFMAVINPQKNDTILFNLELSEVEGTIKMKNTVSFEDTLALKLSATFKNWS